MREIEIKKIVLKVGKRELNFTIEKAKKLFEVLGGMFGKEIIREYPYGWRWIWPENTITISRGWTSCSAGSIDFSTTTDANCTMYIDGSCLTVSI